VRDGRPLHRSAVPLPRKRGRSKTSASPRLRVKMVAIRLSTLDVRTQRPVAFHGFPLARATPARNWTTRAGGLLACGSIALPAFPVAPVAFEQNSPPTVAGAARVSDPVPFAVA